MSGDEIQIRGLQLRVHVGVPEHERRTAQTVEADIVMRTAASFEVMGDELPATVDYEAVAARIRALAGGRPRKLIETLAAEIADCVLREFGAASVAVEVRKRILPGVGHVAVKLERAR